MDSVPSLEGSSSAETLLSGIPPNRVVVMLLRHAERPMHAHDVPGDLVSITESGRSASMALGRNLGSRLASLRSSPILRCIESAEALRSGAASRVAIERDDMLGAPGAFVENAESAGRNWRELGNAEVIRRMMSCDVVLPGMVHSDTAARRLVWHMFDVSRRRSGLHVFVSHDALIAPTLARFLGRSLQDDEWPDFLEAACFWQENSQLVMAYRGLLYSRPSTWVQT